LQLWLVIKVCHHYHCYVDFPLKYKTCGIDLNTVDPRIKETVVELNKLHSILRHSAAASDVAGMFVDLGIAISKVIYR